MQSDCWWLGDIRSRGISSHAIDKLSRYILVSTPGDHFKNVSELVNLRAPKFSILNKNHLFQCMGKIFCVEFQRFPLKFHTKNLTHTLKDVYFIDKWQFMSSYIYELLYLRAHKCFWNDPQIGQYNSQKFPPKPPMIQCGYNAVQYNKIVHTSLQELRQNINQKLNAPKISPVSYVRIL